MKQEINDDHLTPEQIYILRENGTEPPFSGVYNLHFETGTYYCASCNNALFTSNSKFKSGCGWPSFDNAIENAIIYKKDNSFGMERIEIKCSKCDGHLGHVFDDGPTETKLRYCVNSLSLTFK